MSIHIGATVECDQHIPSTWPSQGAKRCGIVLKRQTEEDLRQEMKRQGWTEPSEGNHACFSCTERLARRPKLADKFPEHVLLDIETAMTEAGWLWRDLGAAGLVPICCGDEVALHSFIGGVYACECKTCGSAIFDVTGPRFEGASVITLDTTSVNCDTEERWLIAEGGATDE